MPPVEMKPRTPLFYDFYNMSLGRTRRDDGYHDRPGYLRGDDSILNCCMFFTLGIKMPLKVTIWLLIPFALSESGGGLVVRT